MGWKSRFFCGFVKFWPLGWKSGFFLWFCRVLTSGLEVWVFLWFCKVLTSGLEVRVFSVNFVGFWPLKKCSICFLAPTLFDTVGFEVAPKGRPGGIRASDLQAPSPNCLVVHPLDLPKIPKSKIPKIQNPKSPKSKKSQNPKSPKSKIQNPQNPKSPKSQNPKSKIPKIQNPNFFGRILGILDFGSLCSNSFTWGPQRPKFWILAEDFGFWGFGILDFGDFGFWGFWIFGNWDFGLWGFWILGILDFRDFGDFGFWIFGTLCSRSLCAKFGFWNLGILDFGFWGSWILDFGLGILDGHLVTKFWMLHKKRSCARRPGSADYHILVQ